MSNLDKKITIDFSTSSLFKVLFIIGLVAFMFFVRDVLLLVFVALILASALDPAVDYMQKHKLPRSIGIILIYLVVIGLAVGIVYAMVPPITTEVNELINDAPMYQARISELLSSFNNYSITHGLSGGVNQAIDTIKNTLAGSLGGVFNVAGYVFGGIASFFVVLAITFYMTIEEQAMKRLIRSTMPIKYQPYLTHLINRMQDKIGLWLRGQLLLSLIIFLISWIGLSVLGVKYALVLALFAGFTEVIPYLGPLIGAIPAVFIGFTQSPVLGLFVIILYWLLQFFENHAIVPIVMKKTVGLNPVIVIIVLLLGAKVAGILGILMAVPVTTALSVIVADLIEIRSIEKKEELEEAEE
jgi:predicted PurR-regulated permease PerM